MTINDKTQPKRRRLTDITFEHEGAHLALVHKDQGGAANGYSTLVMKSAKDFTPEIIHKMQQVRVTMELDDFLEKFFGLWEDDAAVLAAMMGYKEEADGESEPSNTYNDDSFWVWYKDKCGSNDYYNCPEPTNMDYQEWVATRLEGIEVIKSLGGSDNLNETLTLLNPEQRLALLKDQERIEKAFSNDIGAATKRQDVVKKQQTAAKADVVEVVTTPKARVISKGAVTNNKTTEANSATVHADNITKKGKIMTTKTKPADTFVVEQTVQQEMVEKAQYDAVSAEIVEIRKALDAQQEVIKAYEAEKKAAIAKARQLDLEDAVCGVKEHAEALFKAVGDIKQEDFATLITVLKSLTAATETDPLFTENGSNVQVIDITKAVDTDKVNAELAAYIQASRVANQV
jgi:hypothetical protein